MTGIFLVGQKCCNDNTVHGPNVMVNKPVLDLPSFHTFSETSFLKCYKPHSNNAALKKQCALVHCHCESTIMPYVFHRLVPSDIAKSTSSNTG
jgi:hypothetical protein